jgi:alkylated DNA repair dioxygenase AlkB
MDFSYHPGFLVPEFATSLFGLLEKQITWHTELLADDGAIVPIKRAMAYASDVSTTYRYAGLSFSGQEWLLPLLDVKAKLENETNYRFNSVLLNKYQDGKDEIRWHADKEPQLGPNPVIATVNIGESRTFHLLNLETKEKTQILLHNGDLLLMLENCQQNYVHAILKEKHVTEPRISLTYRLNDDTRR